MITEQDLKAAIAECEGAKSPNANTCIKLAAYYTILNYLTEEKPTRVQEPAVKYSYDNEIQIPYSDSEFSQIIEERGIERAFPVIDELMETLKVLNTRLYQSVVNKLLDN